MPRSSPGGRSGPGQAFDDQPRLAPGLPGKVDLREKRSKSECEGDSTMLREMKPRLHLPTTKVLPRMV
jgi:hypothetical protein